MKPKPDFDPDWTYPSLSPRRLWPFKSIRQLMVAVAAVGMLLAASVTLARQPTSSIIFWDPGRAPASAVPPRLAFYPALETETATEGLVIACPVDDQQPFEVPDDPSRPIAGTAPGSIDPKMVIMAPKSIDPKMVVRAPAWIDPKMVFTPGGVAGQAELGQLPAEGQPEIAPGVTPYYDFVPIPDGSSPPAKMPRYKVVPDPDGSSPPAKTPRYKLVPDPDGSLPPAKRPKYKAVPDPDGSSPPAKRPRYKLVPVPDGSSGSGKEQRRPRERSQ
jgi:hypothetical protein